MSGMCQERKSPNRAVRTAATAPGCPAAMKRCRRARAVPTSRSLLSRLPSSARPIRKARIRRATSRRHRSRSISEDKNRPRTLRQARKSPHHKAENVEVLHIETPSPRAYSQSRSRPCTRTQKPKVAQSRLFVNLQQRRRMVGLGLLVASGSTPPRLSLARSSSSTKTSITRHAYFFRPSPMTP
jgi:hypothetical protein